MEAFHLQLLIWARHRISQSLGDPCTPTGRKSTKKYKMTTGHIMSGREEALMDHKVQEPAWTCDIMPGVTEDSLISTSKFSNAGYITIFDGVEVNIYNASNTKMTVIR